MIFPQHGRRLRIFTVMCGVAVFLWSTPEDQHLEPVLFLATACALLTVCWWLMQPRWFGGKRLSAAVWLAVWGLFGASSGLGTSLAAALLMVFKNFRHAHLYPDYPLGLIGAILERAPIWALAGGLIGIGIALVWIIVLPNHPNAS